MSRPVSALPGAQFEGFAEVREAGFAGMITLRGNLDDKALAKAVKKVTGAALPGRLEIRAGKQGKVAWMSPDELLLFVMHAQVGEALAALEAALNGTHFQAVDVSDARAVFHVTGARAREVVQKLTPADLSGLAPGMFRRSRLAQVPAAFHMPDAESFEIICFRSMADYMFKLLSNAAKPGREVF